MSKAQEAVREARTKLQLAEMWLDDERRRRTILCSCGKRHAIGKLHVLAVYWYTVPSGCTGGDYWTEGEWQFICPVTGSRDRLLFNDRYLDWREHGSVQLRFQALYRKLFASVTRIDRDDESRLPSKWSNNYDVDEHRAKFELPEKPKK